MSSLTKIIWLIFVSAFSTVAIASNQCTEIGVWDWYSDDFKDFDGRYMDKPWFSDSHVGVSMETNKMCYEDGWRMLTRRFKCEDYYTNKECSEGAVSRPGSYKPKFALYNIHTGVVRFFLYMDSAVSQTQRIQLNLSLDQGSFSNDYGLFLIDNDEVTAYNEKNEETNAGKVMVFPAYGLSPQSPKWIIFDKYLSYEPDTNPVSGLQFNIYMDGIEESLLKLGGDFNFQFSELQTTQEKSVMETLIGSADGVVKAYASVSELASDLKAKGNKMIDKELIDAGYDPDSTDVPNLHSTRYTLGMNLLSLGNMIGAQSTPLGVVTAAHSLFKAFDNSPSSPKITYGHGSINLEGSTFSQYGLNHRAVGVPGSTHNEPSNNARLSEDGYTGPLGLFHITDRPEMAVFYDLYDESDEYFTYYHDGLVGRLLTNIEDLVKVNPSSGMELTELKVKPYIEITPKGYFYDSYGNEIWYSSTVNSAVHYGFSPPHYKAGFSHFLPTIMGGKLYFYPEQYSEVMYEPYNEYPGQRDAFAGGIGKTINLGMEREDWPTLIGTEFMSDDKAHYWTIAPFNSYKRFEKVKREHRFYIDDIKMQVYLKFEHPNKPGVFAEFVKILDVVEYACDDTSKEYLKSEIGTKSNSVCKGYVDSDDDGIQDHLELVHGLDPYDLQDGLADNDDDGLSNSEEIRHYLNPFDASSNGVCHFSQTSAKLLYMEKMGQNPPVKTVFASDISPMENFETRDILLHLLKRGRVIGGESISVSCDYGTISVIKGESCVLTGSAAPAKIWKEVHGSNPGLRPVFADSSPLNHGEERSETILLLDGHQPVHGEEHNIKCDDGIVSLAN